ncbi:MAG: type II toxin-antitoxin system RelE/ParE family toxin [Gammaproteobacteria bacterium]
MIKSFGDRITEDLYNGISSAKVRRLPPEVREFALYKLDTLNAVVALKELRSPPGNRLEALKGDLAGFYSIRINKQWRIVFRWQGSEAFDVQIIDYQ